MSTARLISGPLQTERLPNGRRKLLRDLIVDLGQQVARHHHSGGWQQALYETVVSVPAGFDTDYSSVPALGRLFMGRWDQHDIAGVVHDWAYRIGVPRAEADRAWRIVARSGERHVGPVRGFLGWAGLRIGGWVAYRKRARERA